MHSYPETNHTVAATFFISSISHFMELYIAMPLQIWGQDKFLCRDSMFIHSKIQNQNWPSKQEYLTAVALLDKTTAVSLSL